MTHYCIYQINDAKDDNKVRYCTYKEVIAKQEKIDLTIYDKAYEFTQPLDDLEDIMATIVPYGCVSLGDIVVVLDSDKIEKGTYYRDNIGWKKLAR